MKSARKILRHVALAVMLGIVAPASAATNGAVLPAVNVPVAGIELAATNFLSTNPFQGQVVRVLSSEGPFDMQLFPASAPKTATNFLRYVDAGFYRGLLVHRSVPGFVIQTGGVALLGSSLDYVPTFAPVTNEFQLSNLRGTVAMAKAEGNPDSATSQWFVNLSNNTDLDTNNGGFTVFARVLGSGMSNVDRIAALPVYNKTNAIVLRDFGSLFSELPLRNHNTNENPPLIASFVLIDNVVRLPTAISSDPNAFTAELTSNNKVRIKFRGFPSNSASVSVFSYDNSTNAWTVSVPVKAPAQKYAGLLERSNRTFPTLATLSVMPTGVFSGSLANRTGTARIGTTITSQQFQLTNVGSGILVRSLGESIACFYDHENAVFYAPNYINTNPAYALFTNTLTGTLMPHAFSGASNDVCPLSGKMVNAVLTKTNESPRPVLGFLQFAFDKAGAAKINATLPDNRTASGSSAVVLQPWSGDRLLPVALFVGQGQTAASLTGMLRVDASGAATSPVTGSLEWLAGTNKSIVQVASAVWRSAVRGSNAITGNTNTISCILRIPALATPEQTLQWGPNNRPISTNATAGVSFRVDAAKGAFSGSASRMENGRSIAVPFRGVLFSSVPPGMESGLRGCGLASLNPANAPVAVKLLVP